MIARPTKHTFISDGSGGCHPAATWTANAPRPHRAAGTESSSLLELPGRVHPGPQASTPGPLGSHLHRLGCLVVGEFPPRVLAPKGALGGPEKARVRLAGQIPAGPAWASPIRGVLVGGPRGVRIPGVYLLPGRSGSLESLTSGLAPGPGSVRSSFLSFPLPFPSAYPPHSFLSLAILHCMYLLKRVLCKSLSVGSIFPHHCLKHPYISFSLKGEQLQNCFQLLALYE